MDRVKLIPFISPSPPIVYAVRIQPMNRGGGGADNLWEGGTQMYHIDLFIFYVSKLGDQTFILGDHCHSNPPQEPFRVVDRDIEMGRESDGGLGV